MSDEVIQYYVYVIDLDKSILEKDESDEFIFQSSSSIVYSIL